MSKSSSATYITSDLIDGDLMATVNAARSEAAARLGGEDGLACIGANLLDGNKVAMTWRREWEEAPSPMPDTPAAPILSKRQKDR